MISLNNWCYQNVSSWGLVPLEIVNLVPRYPLRLATVLMLVRSWVSTVFWAAFKVSLNLLSAVFPYSTFLSLSSEAFFN